MTTQRQRPTSASDAVVRCRADIDVLVSPDGTFRFVATHAENVTVREDGEIRLLERFGPNERAELRFAPAGPDGGLKGIQLGLTDAAWDERQVTVDTEGAYYRDEHDEELPFKVTPIDPGEPDQGFFLSEIGGLTPPETNPFWYVISAVRGGRVYRHDPMLYNTGEGGPPPER